MQLKLFVLPIKNLGAAEAEMNAFLRGHRVLAVKKEFVADGENSFWSFCVEYLDVTAPGPALPGGRLPNPNGIPSLSPALRGTSYAGCRRRRPSTLKGLNRPGLCMLAFDEAYVWD